MVRAGLEYKGNVLELCRTLQSKMKGATTVDEGFGEAINTACLPSVASFGINLSRTAISKRYTVYHNGLAGGVLNGD